MATDVRVESRRVLDWPLVLERLADYARSSRGRAECAGLPLFASAREASAEMELVTQMRVALETSPPAMGFPEIEPLLQGADKGAVLSPEELGHVASVAETGDAARSFFVDTGAALGDIAGDLTPLADLARTVRTSFDGEGRIRDSVSTELARLRRDRERLASEIRSEMERLQKNDAYEKVLQDDYITIRSDRFVLPLKASAKSMQLGIVHDTSRTGETIFVEPAAVVDRNNRLKVTELHLQRETRRILIELAGRVADEAESLRRNMEILTRLDVLLAKAELARALDAAAVEIVDEPVIELVDLRHPVLVLKGGDVVPNDLHAGDPHRGVIITGPNAGGKTVLLKSAALAALMARAGMHVAAVGGRVGFFDPILADIGDQQTVLGDLSTFSAHLANLSAILSACTEGSVPLILLDELFVGTNPTQGAGLARATLEHLVTKTNGLTLATTHYDALKALAAVDERFRNAAMEFNMDELQPTFQLRDGTPGRSYAYDIARRFGLPEELLATALALTDDASRGLEDVIAGLEAREAELAEQTEGLRTARQEVEERAAVHDLEAKRLREEREELNANARDVIEGLLGDARTQIKAIVADAQRVGSSQAAETARRALVDEEAKVEAALPVAEAEPGTADIDLDVGTEVFVPTLGRDGIVMSLDDKGRAQVAVGSFNIEVPSAELQPARNPKGLKAKTRKSTGTAPAIQSTGYSQPNSGNTCDLRGLRVDEALDEIQKYLDQAALDGRSPVFLIHGHGTGALKKSVREYVASSAYVHRWKPGESTQGGDGVTVVDLV